MKVLLATESYWPNIDGGAVAQRNLATNLASNGHEASVIAPGDEYDTYKEKDQGTTVYRTKALTVPFYDAYKVSVYPKKRVENIFDEFEPDVVHVHNPYAVGRSALKAAKERNIPVVGSNHIQPENLFMAVSQTRFLFNLLKDVGWKFIIHFYDKCDFVISPTQTAVDLLLDNGLSVPAEPVSNGINLDVFNPENDGSELREKLGLPDKPIVLYTGRLSGEKHLEVLINAAPKVLEDIDAHFVIGGSGREEGNLKQLVEDKGLEEHFTFPGFIDEENFPQVYALADLFAISSEAELQSIVTLEAVATGLPVVATNKDALPELVHDGENGFLFEPRNSEEMAEKIKSILSDDKLREEMGKESVRISKKHSLDSVVREFEEIYKKVSED